MEQLGSGRVFRCLAEGGSSRRGQVQVVGGQVPGVGVDQLVQGGQDVLRLIDVVGGTPPLIAGDAPVPPAGEAALLNGGGQVQLQGLLGEVEHVVGGEVGLHVGVEDVQEGGHLGQGVPGDHLLGQGDQHLALELPPLHVGVPLVGHVVGAALVVVAVAHRLHGLLAVQVLIAGAEVDVQALDRVVVVHVQGDLDVHAVQLVHQGDEALQVHVDVVVHRHSEGLLDLLHEHIGAAVVVGVVDFGGLSGPGAVHRRVPGNGDHADLPLDGVKAHQDDGVGVAAVHVLAQQDEVIHPVPAHQGVGVLRVAHRGHHTGLSGGVRGLRLWDGGGLDQQGVGNVQAHHNGGAEHQKDVKFKKQAAAAPGPLPGRRLLEPPSAGPAGCAPGGARRLSCAGIDQSWPLLSHGMQIQTGPVYRIRRRSARGDRGIFKKT